MPRMAGRMHLGIAEENYAVRPTQMHRWSCSGSRPGERRSRKYPLTPHEHTVSKNSSNTNLS
jgi:hypothetical protein